MKQPNIATTKQESEESDETQAKEKEESEHEDVVDEVIAKETSEASNEQRESPGRDEVDDHHRAVTPDISKSLSEDGKPEVVEEEEERY